MLVYRIEHPSNGQGPYRFRIYGWPDYRRRMGKSHELSGKHPGPSSEFGENVMTEELYCALHSEERIKEWFRGFRRDLKKDGFKLMVFDCEPVFYSKESGQVLFKRLEYNPIKIKNIP